MKNQKELPFDDHSGKPSRKRRSDLAEYLPEELLNPVAVAVPVDVLSRVHLREQPGAKNPFTPPEADEIRGANGKCQRVIVRTIDRCSKYPGARAATVADFEQLVAKYTVLATEQLAKRQSLLESNAKPKSLEGATNWSARFILLARYYARRSAELTNSDTVVLPFEPESEVAI